MIGAIGNVDNWRSRCRNLEFQRDTYRKKYNGAIVIVGESHECRRHRVLWHIIRGHVSINQLI